MENLCPICGATNNSDALFCEKCGTKIEKPNYCRKCGERIERDMVFCPSCGSSLTDGKDEKNSAQKVNAPRSSNKMKMSLVAAYIIVVGIIFVLVMNNSKPNFQRSF